MPTTARFAGLKLAEDDRSRVKKMLTGRTSMSARAWRRGRTLLLLDRGYTVTAAAEAGGSYRRETAPVGDRRPASNAAASARQQPGGRGGRDGLRPAAGRSRTMERSARRARGGETRDRA